MHSLLLVGLSGSIMGRLLGLVLNGIDTSLGTVDKESSVCVWLSGGRCRDAYRLPTPTLESLATSLLTSLEASWEVPWTLSVMKSVLMSHKKDEGQREEGVDRTGHVVGGVLDGIHYGCLVGLIGWFGL